MFYSGPVYLSGKTAALVKLVLQFPFISMLSILFMELIIICTFKCLEIINKSMSIYLYIYDCV